MQAHVVLQQQQQGQQQQQQQQQELTTTTNTNNTKGPLTRLSTREAILKKEAAGWMQAHVVFGRASRGLDHVAVQRSETLKQIKYDAMNIQQKQLA